MSADNGGPAFPVLKRLDSPSHEYMADSTEGISIRDYFAAKALQGLCANPAVFAPNGRSGWGHVNATENQLAVYCLDLADVMLAERNKSK